MILIALTSSPHHCGVDFGVTSGTTTEEQRQQAEFTRLVTLLVITRIADLYTTFHLTPDLASEANPLVSVLQFRWVGLISISVILCLAITACLHYDLFSRRTVYPADPTLSFEDFASIHWFGRKRPVLLFLLAFAKDTDLRLKYIGYAGSRLLIFIGIVAVMSWFGLANSSLFERFYSAWFPWFPYGLVVIGAVTCLYFFLRREYSIYRRLRVPSGPDDSVVTSRETPRA